MSDTAQTIVVLCAVACAAVYLIRRQRAKGCKKSSCGCSGKTGQPDHFGNKPPAPRH